MSHMLKAWGDISLQNPTRLFRFTNISAETGPWEKRKTEIFVFICTFWVIKDPPRPPKLTSHFILKVKAITLKVSATQNKHWFSTFLRRSSASRQLHVPSVHLLHNHEHKWGKLHVVEWEHPEGTGTG